MSSQTVTRTAPAYELAARRPPDGVEFPERILLASDGTSRSDRAVRLAARIAARHGSHVAIAAVRDGEALFRPGLAEHATQIREATGREPVIFDLPGPPHRAVAHAALDFEAALVITGASERIAHVAPCAVLVARY